MRRGSGLGLVRVIFGAEFGVRVRVIDKVMG